MSCPRVLLFDVVVVSNLAIGIKVLENCVVGSSPRSLGSASTFEAADAVLFQGVIVADAVESEHIDASTGRIHQPIFTLT